jgi:hypothetical protein
MNLQEAKKLLQNNGYTLIREDAYMDAMDQELDDICQNNIKLSGPITLKMPNLPPEDIDRAFNLFKNGRANERACKALGRVCDLVDKVPSAEIDKIETITPGKSYTFTNIPSYFGNCAMTRGIFLEYCSHLGETLMKTLIALSCSKRNSITLGV